MHADRLKVAVVGHVEWVQFARVRNVPSAGDVMHATDAFEEPAGGGAVAAVQLARLAGEAALITALGEDEHASLTVARLRELGVDVHSVTRAGRTRRALTLLDDQSERTIITFGPRLEPLAADGQLPWGALEDTDAVYFTSGDVGALRAARRARVLVASPRAVDALGHGVKLDALVLSGDDAVERSLTARAQDEAELVVFTEGPAGGAYRERSGTTGRWTAATPPGPRVDSYGCGDSFAAGLAYGLGAGLDVPAALAVAARCGAVCLTGRGPYQHQLTAAELEEPADRPRAGR